MMRYLCDTDTLIYLLKHQPDIEAHVQQVGADQLSLSVITVAEVLHGAYNAANAQQSVQETKALIAQFTIIDLNTAIAERFGAIKTELRRQGQILADFDLLIAATALVVGQILVTCNTKHFQRLSAFGLQIENWKTP